MPLDFPASPLVGQTYAFGGKQWRWNGTGWVLDAGSGGGFVPAGQLTLIDSKVVGAAVAAVDFTAGIDGTFDEYELHFFGAQCAANGAFAIRISQDGGATFKSAASSYHMGQVYGPYAAAGSVNFFANQTQLQITALHTAGTGFSAFGVIRFFTPQQAGIYKPFFYKSHQRNPTDGLGGFDGSGSYILDTNAFNAIRIMNTGGNITAGTFHLYGVNKTGTTAARAISAETRTIMDPHRQLPAVNGGPIFAFSNNNLTVTKIFSGAAYWTVMSQPHGRTGRKYFEAQSFGGNPIYCIIGAGPSYLGFEAPASYYPGQNTNSAGFGGAGTFYYGGTAYPNYPPFASGDWLGVYVDTSTGYIAMRNITTNGGWNATALTGDPNATPPVGMLGPYSILGSNAQMSVLACCYYQNQGWNLNFDGPFIGPVPINCSRWGA
jgi:hypothetical protein